MNLTRPPLSYIPLLPILTGVVAGVLLVRYLDVSPWLMGGIALAIALIASLIRLRGMVEAVLAATLSIATTSIAMPRQFTSPPATGTVLSGNVTSASLLAENQTIRVRIDDGHSRYAILLTYATFYPRVEAGDIVRFHGTYSLPVRDTDLPLEDNLADYYYNEGVSLLCYVPQGCLEVTGRNGSISAAMERWRSALVDKISASGLTSPAAGFLSAVIAGDDTLIAPDLNDDYAAAGVAHLLALSGAHVAMIAMVTAILLAPLTWAGHRRTRWWLTIVGLWVFAVATGMSPSVCRAVIMASTVLLSMIFDRPKSALNALCLAAILILVFSPLSLMKTGFQLSFAATLSIILFTPKLSPVDLRKVHGGKLARIAVTTIAATAGTFPLVAYCFHAIPLYFLIANIVAVAVMPLIMTGGIILSLLLVAGIDAPWLVSSLDAVYSLFDHTVTWVARLPHASVGNIYFDGWLIVPMYLTLGFVCAYIYMRHKSYLVLAGATVLFVIGTALTLRPHYADGEAYMVRSHRATTVALHRGDTLCMLTTSAPHNHSHDSLMWADRYRDFIATRGIRHIAIRPLDTTSLQPDGTISFGSGRMLVATALPDDTVAAAYCLVTSGWYGDPVRLHASLRADTMLLSSDINRRRRNRYSRELKEAGIPVIDLSARGLHSP